MVNVLGGSELDLTAAELAAERVDLKIFTVVGGAEITLPDSLNVEISELEILGGNEIDIGHARSRSRMRRDYPHGTSARAASPAGART
ncbi:MAG: hypothetical protein WBP81_08390 [Solirubrobacteraceae bacterium]